MSPELAVAFARETVEAIRRATTPLDARLSAIDAGVARLAAAVETKASATTLVEATGNFAESVAALRAELLAEGRAEIEARAAALAAVLERVAPLAEAAAPAAALERTAADLGGRIEGVAGAVRAEAEARAAGAAAAEARVAALAGAVEAAAALAGAAAPAALLERTAADLRAAVGEAERSAVAEAVAVVRAEVAERDRAAEARIHELAESVSESEARVAGTYGRIAAQADADAAARLRGMDEKIDEWIVEGGIALKQAVDNAVEGLAAQVAEMRGPPGEGFHYRGVFDATAEYGPGDWVTYDGTLWAARAQSQGMTPGTDAAAASWQLAMKRSRDGANGIGWNWRGAFTDGETYRLNDVVRHYGRVFLCRRPTSGSPPIPGGNAQPEWALVVEPPA